MKKVLIFFLILSMVLCCCSCGNKTVKKNDPDHNINSGTVDQNSSDDTVSDIEADDSSENSDYNSGTVDQNSSDDTVSDDYNLNLQNNSSNNFSNNSSSTKPTVVKDRLPDGIKIFDGNYDTYYTVTPKDEHPGVVNMDATYEMLIYDYSGKRVSIDDVTLKVNNSKVTVIGTTLIIPYSVRKGYERVVVTVQNKKDSQKKGTYRFEFLQFTEGCTFEDDFAKDYGNWVEDLEGGQYGAKLPVIKDGYMQMTFTSKNQPGYRSCHPTKQAYGSFSANIKMPEHSNLCVAWWLFTSSGYIPNAESPTSTVGEIDIIEFITGAKMLWHTVHWFDYGDFHKQNHSRTPATFNPAQFCTYSVVWAPEKIWWYVDGKLYKTATGLEEGAGNGSGGMYPILQAGHVGDSNFAEDGYDPLETFPYTVYVDWVEIYGLIID